MVIRPLTWIVLTMAIPLSVLVLASIAAGLAFIVSGQLVGLVFVAVAAFGAFALFAFVTARVWADAAEVGCNLFFQRGRCRREEVAFLRIGRPMTRSGPSCNVVRHDGTMAFRVAVSFWGMAQLTKLAQFIGVPLVDG